MKTRRARKPKDFYRTHEDLRRSVNAQHREKGLPEIPPLTHDRKPAHEYQRTARRWAFNPPGYVTVDQQRAELRARVDAAMGVAEPTAPPTETIEPYWNRT